jgi:hypothetical protein
VKRLRKALATGGLALAMSTVLVLGVAAPAHAFIHEIIGALCRAGGEEVIPPGQIRDGQSFVQALQATGFIESIEETPTAVTINFDPTVPASKFTSAGFDLVIEDGIASGVDLILSPLVIPDPDFAAHAGCHNLNP